MVGKALVSTKAPHPGAHHPMRQMQSACTYCNESTISRSRAAGEMKKRLDILADMGTSIIRSAREPLMHQIWMK